MFITLKGILYIFSQFATANSEEGSDTLYGPWPLVSVSLQWWWGCTGSLFCCHHLRRYDTELPQWLQWKGRVFIGTLSM